MARVPLAGGAYQARNLIASAQRCVNLYEEPLPRAEGEPSPSTQNLTSGLTLRGALPTGPVRRLYFASNGDLYSVAGGVLYYIIPTVPVSDSRDSHELLDVIRYGSLDSEQQDGGCNHPGGA